jgi:hypothetical protein
MVNCSPLSISGEVALRGYRTRPVQVGSIKTLMPNQKSFSKRG